MKYTELHRLITRNGFQFDHAVGSHYFYKDVNGHITQPIPYHGSKEVGSGLARKILKDLGINR